MKHLYKRLFNTAPSRFLLVWLAANFIRLVHYTSRKQMDIAESAKPYISGEKSAVFTFWHGRMMMMPPVHPPRRKMNVLISNHRDGEMIARTMHCFGFSTVRGSSSRGGLTAGRGAVKALQDGDNVSITPDGPRGPAMKVVQAGTLTIATMAGVPVIPVTFSSTRHRRAKSWDRFMIALPFGKLYYKVGDAMWNATPEALEARMVALTEEADAHVRAVS